MKNTLLSLSCIVLLGFQASAQLSDGAIAPDWTLTDIFGNEHTLYEYLDAGKTVVLDFSATWCAPCWAYHNSGAMDGFYDERGPEGTDESMVFFIESDMSTTLDDLYGNTGQTQGDWVTGTPYPIFNPTVYDVVADYAIAYFPTIYKVCPDRTIYEVGQVGQQTFENWIESCTLESMLLSTSGTTCYGNGEGLADIDATGGFGSIYYLWSNGDNTQDLEDVEAGVYAVTISEGMGRTLVIDEIEIEGPLDPMEITNYEIIDLECFEDGTGALSVDAEGGNGGFSFEWSNGGSGSSIQNLQAGSYTVSIYDSESCLLTETFYVEEPELLVHEVETTDDHCFQLGGEITVAPEGGTGPYVLEASGGTIFPGTYTVINLTEGDYSITLTDAHGCSLVDQVSIANIEGPDVTMPAAPTITCETGPTTITPFIINIAGGDLEFSWSTEEGEIISGGEDLECVVGLPGTYTLHVEDLEFGCDIEASIVVEGTVDRPDMDAGPDLALTCAQQEVEPMPVVINEGTLVYEWTTSDGMIISGEGTLTPVFGAPGTYHLTVLNTENGCSNTDQVVITDDRVFPAATFSFASDGLMAIFNSGQSVGTTYAWDFGDGNISTEQNPQHAFTADGTYLVCLTVSNECGSEQNCRDITVVSDVSTILVELTVSNVSCFGDADGMLSAQAFGGTGVYEYIWQTPEGDSLLGQQITDLGPGTYFLNVIDDMGNELAQIIEAIITEPTQLLGQTQFIPHGSPNGPGIDLTVDGGTQGYTYLWSNGATTEDLYQLPFGVYRCTVTDANGCQFVTRRIEVGHVPNTSIHPGEVVQVFGHPGLDPLVIIVDADDNAMHTVRVIDVLGRPLMEQEWWGRSHEIDIREYSAGVYFLAVYENESLLKTIPVAINR